MSGDICEGPSKATCMEVEAKREAREAKRLKAKIVEFKVEFGGNIYTITDKDFENAGYDNSYVLRRFDYDEDCLKVLMNKIIESCSKKEKTI